MFRKFILSLILITLVSFPTISLAAYDSNICTSGDKCTAGQVGEFMKGISKGCGNLGNCSLADIMLVFSNVGNFILGIVGALVLLMYIVGGVFMLASHGNAEYVKKGKKYIAVSTMGLLIIFFAYIGMVFLKATLTGSSTKTVTSDESTVTEEIVCAGAESKGKSCGENSKCSEEGPCLSICELDHPDGSYACDTVPDSNPGYEKNHSCEADKCPGGTNVMCCNNAVK